GRLAAALPDDDLAGFRDRLQPRSEIDGLADDHPLVRLERPRVDEEIAGLDAGPDTQATCSGPVRRPARSRVRRTQRLLRIIRVRDRDAECPENRVADVLLDDATVGLDRSAQLGKRVAQE